MPSSPPTWLSPLLNLISFHSEIPDLVDRIVPDNAGRGQGRAARERHREERDFLDDSDTAMLLSIVALGRAITQSVAIRPWCKHPAECCDDEERDHVIPVRDRKRKTISKWILRLQNRRLIKKSNVKETKGEEIKTPELPGKDGKTRKITPKAHEVVLKSTPELDELIHGLRPHVSKHAVDLVLALLKENAHPEAEEAARLLREIMKEEEGESR